MPEPVKIDQDTNTRIIIENHDGVLVAHVQRRWNGAWTDFGEASGGDGTFHIRPSVESLEGEGYPSGAERRGL